MERKPSDIRSGPELIRIPPARSAIEMDLRGKRELIRAKGMTIIRGPPIPVNELVVSHLLSFSPFLPAI